MADFKNPDAEIQRLRALPYAEYLQSPWWRRRRHARLDKAGGKCERCGKVVMIADVHHVLYDRLGDERDNDLEILCRTCHATHHFNESRRQHIGQYEMLARETIRLDHPTGFSDFKDAFRERCQQFHIPIDHRFDDAMTIVWKKAEVSLVSAARREDVANQLTYRRELPPLTQQEAVDLCRRLGMKFPLKSMPATYGTRSGVAANRARTAAWLEQQHCPQCQRAGAQLSGVDLGWLYCIGCRHKWELPAETLETLRKA